MIYGYIRMAAVFSFNKAVRNNRYVGYLLLNQVDSAGINIEELFALDNDAVSALLTEVQNTFVTKKIIINPCSVGSSIYETAIKIGSIQSYNVDHLFIKILNSNKLLAGMKDIFEKRFNKEIDDPDLNRIYELFNILNEEQKASLLVGKSSYQELIINMGSNINESDLNMMNMIFP